MSESSRSRVTITLGRSGQVVKRDGSTVDSSFTDLHPVAGSKRSVHERLGSNVDSSAQVGNKRLRGDGRRVNAVSDVHLRKDDLRYKIMKKNIMKQSRDSPQSALDLRSILSRPAQSSTNSISSRERMPESKDSRLQHMEPMEGKHHSTETRDGRHLLPFTQSLSQHIPEFHAPNPRKQSALEGTGGGRSIPDAKGVRHRMPDSSYPGMTPNIPGMRAPSSIDRMESGVNSYSPWTLDRLRQRSPDESFGTTKGVTAPKRDEELQRRYSVMPYDDTRTNTYMTKDALDVSRPMSSSHLAKMAPPVGQMRTMTPMSSTLPSSGNLVQKNSYVDDQVTVDSFLRSLGLDKYSILFKAEEVDMYSLKRMTERDLKELGIPMGPRKKILLTLQPRLKQP